MDVLGEDAPPKLHDHDEGELVLRSVKATVPPADKVVGVPEKLATGAPGLTVI